jgi:hypothetical protein
MSFRHQWVVKESIQFWGLYESFVTYNVFMVSLKVSCKWEKLHITLILNWTPLLFVNSLEIKLKDIISQKLLIVLIQF